MSAVKALTIAIDHLSSNEPTKITTEERQRAIEHLEFSREFAAGRAARRAYKAEGRRSDIQESLDMFDQLD